LTWWVVYSTVLVPFTDQLCQVGHYKDFVQGILNGTLVPVNNGTFPSSYPLETNTGNLTKREIALQDYEARRYGGCMH
jgi:acetylornithine deacetylase